MIKITDRIKVNDEKLSISILIKIYSTIAVKLNKS